MTVEFPDWGCKGLIQFGLSIFLGILGFIIAVLGAIILCLDVQGRYNGLSLVGVGIAIVALAWNLIVTQFNAFNTSNLAKDITEIKAQLNRIENR
jgi:uncharacterized membrane protein (DUF373 family)